MEFQPGNGQFLPRFGQGFGPDFGQVLGQDLGQIFGQDFGQTEQQKQQHSLQQQRGARAPLLFPSPLLFLLFCLTKILTKNLTQIFTKHLAKILPKPWAKSGQKLAISGLEFHQGGLSKI